MNEEANAVKRFWVSWFEPLGDYRPLNDPPNAGVLGWWCTGERRSGSGPLAVLCAVVAAGDEQEAKAAIATDWPGEKLWRFCEETPSFWRPAADRFPLSGWMAERLAIKPQG